MNKIHFQNSIEKSYVRECQIRGFLDNVELLQTYLIQYANQNLFENEKQTQPFQIKKYIYPNLNSNMNNEEIMFTYEIHVNDDTSNIVKYIQHNLKDEIQNILSHYVTNQKSKFKLSNNANQKRKPVTY
jgi:predicted metal-dependent hydrolase